VAIEDADGRVLFFSRGRGRGHAVPDMAIAAELERLSPGVNIQFVSYATGARTLAAGGYDVIDLTLPEEPPFLDVLVRSAHCIRTLQPRAVVSHEEFAVLPAAAGLGIPSAMIVDFFMPNDNIWMQSLAFAERIVFIEERGIFPEPPHARGKVAYVGPVVRPMSVDRAKRDEYRDELELPRTATVIAVMPGSFATERRAPIADVVLPAFQALSASNKRLVWLAGEDYEKLAERSKAIPEVIISRGASSPERLMIASDLVITKANRGTTIELAALGIPSLSLSFGLNPIDETIIPRIVTNRRLDARGIDGAFLAASLESILASPAGGPPAPGYGVGSAHSAAREVAGFLARHLQPTK